MYTWAYFLFEMNSSRRGRTVEHLDLSNLSGWKGRTSEKAVMLYSKAEAQNDCDFVTEFGERNIHSWKQEKMELHDELRYSKKLRRNIAV